MIREQGCSHQEVVQHSSFLRTLFRIVTFVFSGEATEAVPFAFAHMEVFYYSMGAAIMVNTKSASS